MNKEEIKQWEEALKDFKFPPLSDSDRIKLEQARNAEQNVKNRNFRLGKQEEADHER